MLFQRTRDTETILMAWIFVEFGVMQAVNGFSVSKLSQYLNDLDLSNHRTSQMAQHSSTKTKQNVKVFFCRIAHSKIQW